MKRRRKRREHVKFPVARVFPPDDALGVDLLRLMAFHDDLSFIAEMMQAAMARAPQRAGARQVAASRWFFLQRLFGAVVAELVKVVQNVQNDPQFAELRRSLSPTGGESLQQLLSMPFDEQHPVYGVLYRTRNKAAFHFDRNDFAAAIGRLIQKLGEDAQASFLLEADPKFPDTVRTHYMLAGQIALEASYGLKGDMPDAAFGAAINLHWALSEFLASAFAAYCDIRGIQREIFRHTVIDE